MKPCRLLQWKLCSLRDQARDIVVKIEQNRQKHREWDRQKHVRNANVPKVNKPTSVRGGEESPRRGKIFQFDVSHFSKVLVSSKKDHSQGGSIVFQENPNGMREQMAFTQNPTDVSKHQYEQSDGD